MFQQERDRQDGYRPCVGLILVLDGKVLLGRKEDPLAPDARSWATKWDIPQGGVEPDETFGQACKRETREELGDDWWVEVNSRPELFHRHKPSLPVNKDGKKWRCKTDF